MASDRESEGFVDEFGFVGPLPMSSGQRKIADAGFPTGPKIGQHLPDFTLTSHLGEPITFHQQRAESKAAVVFFRSAVW